MNTGYQTLGPEGTESEWLTTEGAMCGTASYGT
jgi:hypothetical protein